MSDQEARTTAKDINRSFIVQAPAGSGKTELLIQRFLALLPSVEVPEQIFAITFTRKAAAEMRGRVIDALKEASAQAVPDEDYRCETYELALKALAKDKKEGWGLIDHPQRLKIDTLDSLNAWLAHQLPLLSGGVAGASIVEDAGDLYSLAARRLIEQLGEGAVVSDALHTLLRQGGFGIQGLEDLLAGLLPTRDHWMRYLFTGDAEEIVQQLEEAIHRLIDSELAGLCSTFPTKHSNELVALLQHASQNATRTVSLERFAPWQKLEKLPPPDSLHLEAWRSISELLLTQRGGWRKQLGAIGFSADYAAPRRRLIELIETLSDKEDLRLALLEVQRLPDPVLAAPQKDLLIALRQVLPNLVGELKLLFEERNSVDFVELALAAQTALGDADAPSELLLALDRRLQHVLVDEFQDTSYTQLKLLELLTAGWEQSDGRTLFLVGDPMQSIYRFRNADMSLFLNTKLRGIGEIHCESLTLERNFRSRPQIIEWINQTFAQVFPDQDLLKSGEARFNPCKRTRPPSSDEGVEVHALRGADPAAEVRRVADILINERASSRSRSIAILVQSRSHLTGLTEQLRPLDLPIRAVEITAPNQYQVVQDLIGLTRALTHRGDRIAWLGLLRAPWCGLSWQDLHSLCVDDRQSPIWALMNDGERLARLSADGRERLLGVRGVLQLAFQTRSEQPFARWIERTWMSLGGPACLDYLDELDRADRFFLTLAESVTQGDLDDPVQLEKRFKDPRIGADPPREKGIEIMTIHRAKGLQFDTVVLLGLGRGLPPESKKGLNWLELRNEDGSEDILLSPPTANPQQTNALTEWIRRIDRNKNLSERARLLYVATTRARERLHLIGQLPENQAPRPSTLLACLWPDVSITFEDAEISEDTGQAEQEIRPVLRRLVEPARALERSQENATQTVRPQFEWAGQAAVQVGTVVHRWLNQIAEDSPEQWNSQRVISNQDRFRTELGLLGVEPRELSWASARIVQALQNVLDDERGRWILKSHSQARSELEVTVITSAGLEHIRLDRTFIDEHGVRWIIDYKTSSHDGGATEEFLASEVERYGSQLQRYALAMSQMEERAIRLGLYFPLLQAFKDWEPVQTGGALQVPG
jgi:ATP-dependent exoDNAse (exonuclease V) beta subunit